MKKKNKQEKNYTIDLNFYYKLVIYIALMAVIFIGEVFFAVCYAYLAKIDISIIPQDVCDVNSPNHSFFYCYLTETENGTFYYFLVNFMMIGMIFLGLSFIIVNIIYIVNRFFYKRLFKEKSCGAVIFKIENDNVYYLLLRMGYGHVSLCKGHQEKNETDSETALREIKEETNLDVDLNTDFVATIKYKTNESTIKDVIFFLAKSEDNATPCDLHDEEVESYEWCDYSDALFKITHTSDRDVIKKAHRYIKHHYLIKEE